MNIGHQKKKPKIESTGVSGHPVSDECEFLRKHSLILSFPLNELNEHLPCQTEFVLVYAE